MTLFLREDLARAWSDRDPFDVVNSLTGQVYRVKEGRRTLRFKSNGSAYFLKLHTGIGWKEVFKSLLQLRIPILGATNEYAAIRHLEAIGVATLSVAAYGKRGVNPARTLSFIVTDELLDCVSLEDLCANWPDDPPPYHFRVAVIHALADISKAMHESGMNHRDFYLCHFLLPRQLARTTPQSPPVLHLMDLHRAQIRPVVPRRWRTKDLAGLYFSALDVGLGPRDVLRFVRRYSGKSLKTALREDEVLWRQVALRAKALYERIHGRTPALPIQAR